MGKYFKDQDHNLPKKRFKKSNLSNAQNVREASLFSFIGPLAKNLNKFKNFMWAWTKVSKGIKLDPKIINGIENAFEEVSSVYAKRFLDKQDEIAKLEKDLLTATDANKKALIQEAIAKAKSELDTIESQGLAKINAAVDEFNVNQPIPVVLKTSGGFKTNDLKLDFGILSQQPGDVVDPDALRKALIIMREVNPADADPVKRIMSLLRGGQGAIGDVARPFRNISTDLTIRNLMSKRYTFKGPQNSRGIEPTRTYSLSDILEKTAKDGRFEPETGYHADIGVQEAVARDFNNLMKRTEIAQSGLKNPTLLTGVSILTAFVTANFSQPYWVPLVAGIPSMTKRFTDSDGNVKEQEQANDKLFRGNNTTDNNDLNQASREQINSDIQYYQNKMSTETNPIFYREYQVELNRLNRKLERLNSGGR
jgi:hypothetical protein